MRTYDKLSEQEQAAAVEHFTGRLLGAVLNGAVRFNDALNGDTLQATIDWACQEAEAKQTPWFAHEYIMEARYNPGEGHVTEDDGQWPVAEALRSMATCDAESAIYLDPDDGDAVRVSALKVASHA